MEIEILEQQCGGTEFVPSPHRLHLGAQNAEGVDRLQFILPAAWAECTLALYLRRSDGVQLAAIPLDTDGSVTVDRRLTGSVRGQWMLAAMGSGGYTAYTRPGSYDVYATLPTDGGSEELPPSVYEQFVARVLESARAAAESARRAENGAADTAVQAALAQKAADKILADRTDADACAKRAEAAALRAENYAPADGRVLSVNGKGGAVRLTAQDVAAVPRPAQPLPGAVVRILSVNSATGAVQTDTTPLPDLRPYVRSETVPTAETSGAVRADGQYGVAVRADATLTTVPATAAQLDRMTEAYAPLTPALLPYGVKKALTSAAGAAGWSAQEKAAALLQLGADDRFYSKAEADRKFGTAYTLGEGLFGMRWQGLLALALCGVLLSIALIDAQTQLIPNRLNAAVAVLAVLNLLLSPARWAGALIGMVCISVPMLLLCLAIPGAFGGGDIKLMAAAGLFLGWQHTLLVMFFGILGGGFYGIYLLAARKADKKDHFAFGPFLCVGIVLALLFGDPVLAWYCRFL